MAKRLIEYEPTEQSLLYLLMAVTHQQAIVNELYMRSLADLDQSQRNAIDRRIREVYEALEGAVRTLESQAEGAPVFDE